MSEGQDPSSNAVGRGGSQVWGLGSPYIEVQCIMGNDHMGLPVNRQTDMTENITFPQPCWQAVNIVSRNVDHLLTYF